MPFGYEFITLSEVEKLERRRLLNLYGAIAQWSPLVILAGFQLYFFVSWLARRSEAKSSLSTSPRTKSVRLRNQPWFVLSSQQWQVFWWWADEEIVPGWGSRKEWILAVVWTTWSLFLCVHRTGNDFLHLTKRFGIVGTAQLPLLYLLALRSAYSPIQILTRLSHEQIKAVHQILGRVLMFIFALHAAFYLNFFIASALLPKRIRDVDVILGLTTLFLFAIVTTSALKILRQWNYRVFITSHSTIAILVLPFLQNHVVYALPYALEAWGVILLHLVLRSAKTRTYDGAISLIPGTDLIRVCIPLHDSAFTRRWKPGQHVYLTRPSTGASSGPLEYLFTRNFINPFSIASLPMQDNRLLLVARARKGNTKCLAALAREWQQGGELRGVSLTLEGPYGAAAYLPDLSRFDSILLVAGGVGATFLVPIYRSGLGLYRGGNPQVPVSSMRFVWAVRRLADSRWAFPSAEHGAFDPPSPDCGPQGVEVFVTRPNASGIQGSRDHAVDPRGVELAEGASLLPPTDGDEKETAGLKIHYGRPDFGTIVDQSFAKAGPGGRVAVLVCGPDGMVHAVRRKVGRWIGRDREVMWHAEVFGL